jgi:hypothetical protein
VDNSVDRSARNILHRVRRRKAVRNIVVVARSQAVVDSPGNRPAEIAKAATNIVRTLAHKATSGVSVRVKGGDFG